MLDEEHQDIPQDVNDTNLYTLGRIGKHNVVLACLLEGQTGTMFHQNKDLLCDSGHGVDLNRLGPMDSNESQGAGKHGSYCCNGCRHVSPGHFV
jgi:hypothetical protein